MDYGAVGDGVTNDTQAIIDCATAAVAAGKLCYLPPGTYKAATIELPNNAQVVGAGATSIVKAASNDCNVFYLLGKSGINVTDLAVYGYAAGSMAGDHGFRFSNTHNCVFERLTFNDIAFSLYFGGDISDSSNIHISTCTALSGNHTFYFAAYADDVYVDGCTIDSRTSDGAGTSHHFYIPAYCEGLYVTNCTMSNGSGFPIQMIDGPGCTNINFTGCTFTNTLAGAVISPDPANGYGSIRFSGLSGTSNRTSSDHAWFWLTGVDDMIVDDWTLDGADVTGVAECYSNTAGGVVFSNGTMTNCSSTYYAYTPAGFKTGSGEAPTSTNNTVTT
jgi:hypothetical protein